MSLLPSVFISMENVFQNQLVSKNQSLYSKVFADLFPRNAYMSQYICTGIVVIVPTSGTGKFLISSAWLKILSDYCGPSPVKKYAHTGEIITIIIICKILLKDGCHTIISDATGKLASLTGMAMRSVFGIL
jgi:hypothetical protein